MITRSVVNLRATAALAVVLVGCVPVEAHCFNGSKSACQALEGRCVRDEQACTIAARAYYSGQARIRDARRSLELYREACSRDPERCGELVAAAENLPNEKEVSEDEIAAAFATACLAGRGTGCRALAGRAPFKESAPALALSACMRGDAVGCRITAEDALFRNEDVALGLASVACDSNDTTACLLSAALLLRGTPDQSPAFSGARGNLARAQRGRDKRAVKLQDTIDQALGVHGDDCTRRCTTLAGVRGCASAATRCFELSARAEEHGGLSVAEARSVCRDHLDRCVTERDADPVGLMVCRELCAKSAEGNGRE